MKLPKKIQTVDEAEKFSRMLTDMYLAEKPIPQKVFEKINVLRWQAITAHASAVTEINVAVNSIYFDLVVKKVPKPRQGRG